MDEDKLKDLLNELEQVRDDFDREFSLNHYTINEPVRSVINRGYRLIKYNEDLNVLIFESKDKDEKIYLEGLGVELEFGKIINESIDFIKNKYLEIE